MSKYSIVCAIEHILKNEGCNEMPACEVLRRIKETRGNRALQKEEFLSVLQELINDGLYEHFGEGHLVTEDDMIARSQSHPSLPFREVIRNK